MTDQRKNKRVLTGTHFMMGNFAVVEGALAAGCDFFAGYPITPANEISEQMAQRMAEVGGTMEIEATEYIKKHMTKPVVSLIVGRSAPEGAQMGHAGAIIEGQEGTATNKIKELEKAGVHIAYRPSEIPQIIRSLGVL